MDTIDTHTWKQRQLTLCKHIMQLVGAAGEFQLSGMFRILQHRSYVLTY